MLTGSYSSSYPKALVWRSSEGLTCFAVGKWGSSPSKLCLVDLLNCATTGAFSWAEKLDESFKVFRDESREELLRELFGSFTLRSSGNWNDISKDRSNASSLSSCSMMFVRNFVTSEVCFSYSLRLSAPGSNYQRSACQETSALSMLQSLSASSVGWRAKNWSRLNPLRFPPWLSSLCSISAIILRNSKSLAESWSRNSAFSLIYWILSCSSITRLWSSFIRIT